MLVRLCVCGLLLKRRRDFARIWVRRLWGRRLGRSLTGTARIRLRPVTLERLRAAATPGAGRRYWCAVLWCTRPAVWRPSLKLGVLTPRRWGRICSGAQRLSVGELAGLLERSGAGLRVRLEVYDDHDDGLHLSALSDPERHRRIKARAEQIFAGARPL